MQEGWMFEGGINFNGMIGEEDYYLIKAAHA